VHSRAASIKKLSNFRQNIPAPAPPSGPPIASHRGRVWECVQGRRPPWATPDFQQSPRKRQKFAPKQALIEAPTERCKDGKRTVYPSPVVGSYSTGALRDQTDREGRRGTGAGVPDG
jgi:hypothetical protein